MPIPYEFNLAPDFTVCEYCGKSYPDTTDNMHLIKVERNREERIFVACVSCIRKAEVDKTYDDYMTDKTFTEKLGRVIMKKGLDE